MKIQKLSEKLITLLAVAVLVVVMNIIDVACVFKEIFGIFCPGCGMTRAYISLLYLDFRSAFLYTGNPKIILNTQHRINPARIPTRSVVLSHF